MAVRVNGCEIAERDIAREAQHHPAGSLEEARRNAATALVVRQLLLDAADRLGVQAVPQDIDGVREAEDEARIRALIETEVQVPEANEAACRRYYESNPGRFRSPDMVEARHILFMAAPDDAEALEAADARAQEALETLKRRPDSFANMARDLSDCPSGKQGGSLGQVTRGQTVPELETFLFNLEDGQLCPVVVKSRYGRHVVRVERRIDGRQLPFEAVQERIETYLEERVWRQGVRQFIALLVGEADIEGLELEGATSPLVQ